MESVSVIYLRKETILDISTKDKLQTAVLKITKVIANKIKPLYRIAFILLYDAKEREQIFEEELYNAIDSNVKKYIYNNVYHYISENDKINIEGFIIFRLKLLWDIIDSTIRQFIEYNFSLNELLNQITENSKSICNTIIIIAERENYSIYDESMNLMVYIKKYDDTLLDVVLNIAPKKIYIYNRENFTEKALLNNICAIFKNKVFFRCKGHL